MHPSGAGLSAKRRQGLSLRAVKVCTKPRSLRRTSSIAGVVGTCLVVINQLGAILDGQRGAILWVRVALDYLVPFVVSNLGMLSAASFAESAAGSANGERDFAEPPKSGID